MGLRDKYSELFSIVGQINSSEDLEDIFIKEEDLKDIYEGETRLLGFYNLDGKLCRMTLISLKDSRVNSVDYYLDSDKLIFVIEASDLLTKRLEVVNEESRHSMYIFQDNRIYDFERVGNYNKPFDKETTEKIIMEDTLRNVNLLTKKWTESQHVKN